MHSHRRTLRSGDSQVFVAKVARGVIVTARHWQTLDLYRIVPQA